MPRRRHRPPLLAIASLIALDASCIAPSTARAGGRIALFVRSHDTRLYSTTWSPGTWSAWTRDGGSFLTDVALTTIGNDHLWAMGAAPDRDLFYRHTEGGDWVEPWWDRIIEQTPEFGLAYKVATGATLARGFTTKLVLAFVRREPDGHMVRFGRPDTGRRWTDEVDSKVTITTSPTAIRVGGDGPLELFARAGDLKLRHWTMDSDSTAPQWGTFDDLEPVASRTAVAVATNGKLHVFARGGDGTLRHIARPVGGPWSAWESLGGQITSAPTAVTTSDGVIHVFARSSRGTLVHMTSK